MATLTSFLAAWWKVIVIAVVVILIFKFLFGVNGSKLRNLIINALLGFVLIYVINLVSFLPTIPSNIITWLVAGAFGIPGVVVLLILSYLHII